MCLCVKQVLILALLLVPSITANTAEIAKRLSGSSGFIRVEMPSAEPQMQLTQTTPQAAAAQAAAAAPEYLTHTYAGAPTMRLGFA